MHRASDPRPRRYPTRLICVVAAVLLLAATQVGTAVAYVPVDTSGRTGVWSIVDDTAQASLRCSYAGQDLGQLEVSPPTVYARTLNRRRVGWQFEVLRAQWWREQPGNFYVAYTSPLVKARASRTQAATFSPRQWAIPDEWQTAYDSFKVRVRMKWFAADATTVVGETTIELEYHEVADGGGGGGTTIEGPGPCVGSLEAPVAPPSEPRAPVPAGFERMTHWQPYWQVFSEARVQATIADLLRMHQTGVILTGMESGHSYSLPVNVAHYLQMFRDAGIKPYLSLWVAKFSDVELTVSRKAWNAGNGKWAGIVLDVERGLELSVAADRAATITRLGSYMAQIRPLTPFLAYSTFAYPTDHPLMLYSELNSYCDVYMPQLYMNPSHPEALAALDGLQAAIDFESPGWADPPIPIVPVVNDWGKSVKYAELQQYIDIVFARYGAISGWRLHPDMTEQTKDLWASITP